MTRSEGRCLAGGNLTWLLHTSDVVFTQCIHCFYIVFTWCPHGVYMVFTSFLHCAYTVFTWSYTVFTWCLRGCRRHFSIHFAVFNPFPFF